MSQSYYCSIDKRHAKDGVYVSVVERSKVGTEIVPYGYIMDRPESVYKREHAMAKAVALRRQACVGRDTTHDRSLAKRRFVRRVMSLYCQVLPREGSV